MKVERWDALDPIQLTAADVRAAFLWRRKNGSLVNLAPELFLPSAYTLHMRRFDLSDILTPLEARDLNGFRLVCSGRSPDSGRISEITRAEGRVIQNHAFEGADDITYLLVHKFLDAISIRFSNLCQYPGFLAEKERPPVAYSTQLVERLLIDSLVSPRKPRLAPPLILPSEADIFLALRDAVEDRLPFSLENAADTYSITSAEGQFRMRRKGDRGETLEDFSFPELPKVVARFVRSLFGFQAMENDGDWTFDPTSLTKRNF